MNHMCKVAGETVATSSSAPTLHGRRTDFNLRVHWIPTIGDDLFGVWNSGYTTDPLAPVRFPSRRVLDRPLNGALVIKAVHRFGL